MKRMLASSQDCQLMGRGQCPPFPGPWLLHNLLKCPLTMAWQHLLRGPTSPSQVRTQAARMDHLKKSWVGPVPLNGETSEPLETEEVNHPLPTPHIQQRIQTDEEQHGRHSCAKRRK